MKSRAFLMLAFFCSIASFSQGDRFPPEWFSGSWGTSSCQIGIILPSPDMLPQGPFQGPGGFRVDEDVTLWMSDSVQKKVKKFSGETVQEFPVPAKKLGDLVITKEKIFVASIEPNGILVLAKKTGTLLKQIPVPFKTPGRLLVADENHIAVEETGGGVWVIINGKAAQHPASALEPVGTNQALYGTLFDFEASSRKIIKAGWEGETTDPDLFSLFREPGRKIVFSRLVGLIEADPVLVTMTGSEPEKLHFTRFGSDGTIVWTSSCSILPNCYMPSSWIVGNDGKIYEMRADLKGFYIYRFK